MNTKTFAQESRKILMAGVAKKLLYWGFNEQGEVLEEPQKISGGYLLRGEPYDDPNVPKLWASLRAAIRQKGLEVVVEEAAYTWFNRIMALRIMVKNGYEQPQLDNVPGMAHTPILLQKARQGQSDFLSPTEQKRLQKIISDYTQDQEAFALLLIGYCHSHKTLNRVFGRIDDYTELLLPDNMLQDSGFLHLLNTTDAISDEDYKQVELIGWLYQFYISEKKDEVFASFKKNKKAEAKDIPAATQIFTPNWIVKYMVENTAGKIWLDKHPDSPLKEKMKYLVENPSPSEGEGPKAEGLINSIEELTLIDPACGSGHILVEGFELLYQMYLEEYYPPEEAVEFILTHNLYGLDIDDRAAQLATFAILLKAAKVYPDIWHKDWLPQVYAMPEAKDFSLPEVEEFLGAAGADYTEELHTVLGLMKQAKNLGSVMKLDLSEDGRAYLEKRYADVQQADYREFTLEAIYQTLKSYVPVLLLLTKKYTSVVANPPYMGQKSMNADLKNYVNKNYPITKSDLMTVFMEVIPNLTQDHSRFALINLPSWLFLSSFEKLRENYLDNYSFDSLLHMGRGIFGIDFGSVAFAIKKTKAEDAIGSYFRLHERNFQHIYYSDIEKLFLYSNGKVDYKYDFGQYRGEEGITEIPEQGTLEGQKLFYPNIPQTNFSKVPGSPIAFWMNENVLELHDKKLYLKQFGSFKRGIGTSDNNRFLRLWSEVNLKKSNLWNQGNFKWVKYNKGGDYRRWYGNNNYFVDWENDGYEIKNLRNEKGKLMSRPQNLEYNFKPVISYSSLTSNDISVRYYEKKFINDQAGNFIYIENESLRFNLLGLLNSNLSKYFIKFTNPTLNITVEDLNNIPYQEEWKNEELETIVKSCIEFSQYDWDSRETSWEFKRSPILNETYTIEQAYQSWQAQVTQDFFQLHRNEEELNRIFIDIYGLQEELTPEVALKDITILQEELNKKDMEALEDDFRANGATAIELPIDKGEVISQFISYAIGLFMGRYRLDKPGLNIAHPNPSAEELESYAYHGGQVIIDEDAIVPLMGKSCNFPDDALNQINSLLDTLWGHDTRTENINFIQECLNKDLEKFLVKDFFKYHCKMYKKKPIYWLFASPKGAFQVLVYMHRMNAFTVEKIRANYLLEHLKALRAEEAMMATRESNLSTQEARKLEQLRKDLRECEAYDLELKNVADQQISFDLDDGVSVNYALFGSVVAKIK
jgi:hypothetical protein